jgi:hypothetical protein
LIRAILARREEVEKAREIEEETKAADQNEKSSSKIATAWRIGEGACSNYIAIIFCYCVTLRIEIWLSRLLENKKRRLEMA